MFFGSSLGWAASQAWMSATSALETFFSEYGGIIALAELRM